MKEKKKEKSKLSSGAGLWPGLQSAFPECGRPLGQSPAPDTRCAVIKACIPSTEREMETGGQSTQGHTKLYGEFLVSLTYTKLCLKTMQIN